MIERENTNELQGQYTLDDLLPGNGGNQAAQPMEGYDAEGNLLNVDYPPVAEGAGTGAATSSDPPQAAAHLPLKGKAFGDEEPKESLPQQAEPAVQGKVDFPENACIVPGKTEEVASPQTPADDEARLSALATEINAITEQTRGVVISAALAVGKRLIEARSLCQEGRWLEWLSKSVSYSERKAQDMMRLYVEYGRDGSIPDSIAALDYSKAVALLSAPADQREALAEQAQADDLSVRQLQAEIKRLKEEAAKAQQTIFDQDYKLKRAAREMEDLNDAHADTVANLNAARDAVQRKEEDFYAALDQKEAELKETKRVLADAAEKVTVAQAKTAAAEAAAEQLRRLRAEAEERADANAQRAGDAVKRANDTAKQLAEAKAKIQALSEAAAAGAPEPEVQTVEVVPEAVQREIEQLKRELAEARAVSAAAGTSSAPDGAPSPEGKAKEATAVEKFKWFYANQMQPTFKTALTLLQEVAREDGHAADAFATAVTKGCQVLMNQMGVGE